MAELYDFKVVKSYGGRETRNLKFQTAEIDRALPKRRMHDKRAI